MKCYPIDLSLERSVLMALIKSCITILKRQKLETFDQKVIFAHALNVLNCSKN